MLFFSFLFLGVFLIVVETTLLHMLPVWAGRPDLLFLLIVYFAFRFDFLRGALLVFFFGLLMDLVSGLYLGLHPVAYLLVFLITVIGSRFIPLNESVYRHPLAVILYVVFATAIFYTYIMIGDGNPGAWRLDKLAMQTGMMALIVFPMFRLYDGLYALCLSRPRLTLGRLVRRQGNSFRS